MLLNKQLVSAIGLFMLFALSCSSMNSSIFAATKIKRLDGSSISKTELEENVVRLMKAARVTGLSVAVINDAKISYIKSFGLRDIKENLPLTEQTEVRALSFSKAVFAYFVMSLVEKGVIDLDKPVYQYLEKPLPEYDNYAQLASDDRYKLITARMLLSHTSGLPNWRWINEEGKLDRSGKLEFKFTPGEKYSYSGEGIYLLQFVVEQITHKSIGELMQKQIFDPFEMKQTAIVWDDRLGENVASGYDKEENPVPLKRQNPKPNAAGSIITTVSDYAKFLTLVMRHENMEKQTFDKMLKPHIQIYSKRQFPVPSRETTDENRGIHLAYGLGWGLMKTPHGKAFFKEGHDDGWQNYTICFPDKKIAVVIMSNSENAESIFKELLELTIKDVYTPWKWESYIPYDSRQ